ncbi:unnamed protein product, partial [Thlaspi arvense]
RNHYQFLTEVSGQFSRAFEHREIEMAMLVANLSSSSVCLFPPRRSQSQKEIGSDVRVRRDVISNKASLRTVPPVEDRRDYADSISTFDRSLTDANTRLRRFCEAGNLESAVKLLRVSGKWDIDRRTLCSVLQLCADTRSLKDGKEVDSFIRSNGFVLDSILGSKLALMYTNCGIDIDLATVVSVFAGCADSGFISLGRAVHGLGLKACLSREDRFCNKLLDMYSKCGDLDSAKAVFTEMSDRTVVSYTSMIAGYAREGLAGEAVKLFTEMEGEGISPDAHTVTAVLKCCARNRLLEEVW